MAEQFSAKVGLAGPLTCGGKLCSVTVTTTFMAAVILGPWAVTVIEYLLFLSYVRREIVVWRRLKVQDSAIDGELIAIGAGH